MDHKCAWCKVDVNKQEQLKADILPDGKCNACGSWNDVGQQVITMNSMKQMYQGCLNLMQCVVETCGDMLKASDIDFDDIKETLDMDKSKPLSIEVGNWQIVKMLFLIHGSSGGTSTGNMTHLLGLKKDGVSFFLEENYMCTNAECPYHKDDEDCHAREGCDGYKGAADI